MDLALNNLQMLIRHKTQQTKPNQTAQNVQKDISSRTAASTSFFKIFFFLSCHF